VLGCHLLGVTKVTASPVNVGPERFEPLMVCSGSRTGSGHALAKGIPIYSEAALRNWRRRRGWLCCVRAGYFVQGDVRARVCASRVRSGDADLRGGPMRSGSFWAMRQRQAGGRPIGGADRNESRRSEPPSLRACDGAAVCCRSP
jgi:hypothetical protein